jgi:Cu(I)/Ag(I) efflux system membrane protein CusA/SilA
VRGAISNRAAALFLLAIALATTIGSEFMPPLDEETVMFIPITDPAISLTKATEILRAQDGSLPKTRQ